MLARPRGPGFGASTPCSRRSSSTWRWWRIADLLRLEHVARIYTRLEPGDWAPRSAPALQLGDDLVGEERDAGLGLVEGDAAEAERGRRLEVTQQLAPSAVLLDD